MKPSHFRGALLEYLVRRLLGNCGFINVVADDLYTFESNGLFFINGKGAAHDADVLMEPPVQMPFTYPYRVLFECKAYSFKPGLPILRNALGLRYDINEFEIVTTASISERRNNRRSNYAIEERKRFNYQIGVASVSQFSKPAIEFAANNKIPLLSLSWFLEPNILRLFNSIDQEYIDNINEQVQDGLYRLLKDRQTNADNAFRDHNVREFLNQDTRISAIIRAFEQVINKVYVGLIETGDLIFLFSTNEDIGNHLYDLNAYEYLKAQIHYFQSEPNVWLLSIYRGHDESQIANLKFFIPDRIMRVWRQYGLDKSIALDIKQEFFSRIFIFNRSQHNIPFFVINIDRVWLENAREELD